MATKLLVALVLAAATLLAQVDTGRIIGHITDPSGAAVPAAAVVITNAQTGRSHQTASHSDGRYESIPLGIGRYRVAVEHPGFKKIVRDGTVLEIQETAQIDFVLEIGASSQEVPVTADAPLLTATEATQGQVIGNRKIVDLPLNGRDYIQLALLSAGAQEPPSNARFQSFSGSGMRAGQTNYILDGIDNNNVQNAAQGRQAEARPRRPDVFR